MDNLDHYEEIPRLMEERSRQEVDNDDPPTTYAASSATQAEQEKAKRLRETGTHPDGTKPVIVPKRIWRPKVQSDYLDPAMDIDEGDDME